MAASGDKEMAAAWSSGRALLCLLTGASTGTVHRVDCRNLLGSQPRGRSADSAPSLCTGTLPALPLPELEKHWNLPQPTAIGKPNLYRSLSESFVFNAKT